MLKRILAVIAAIIMIILLSGCWGGHCEMNGVSSDTVWVIEK